MVELVHMVAVGRMVEGGSQANMVAAVVVAVVVVVVAVAVVVMVVV